MNSALCVEVGLANSHENCSASQVMGQGSETGSQTAAAGGGGAGGGQAGGNSTNSQEKSETDKEEDLASIAEEKVELLCNEQVSSFP